MENQKLPNATAVLVLGIASILTCCCYGFGLILGIVGLVIAKKDLILYKENPSAYSNYSNLNIGRVLCIIGIALGVLLLLFILWLGLTFGWEAFADEELMKQRIEEYFGTR